ncbi:Ribonuclease P protein subunit rpr2 [Bienertia sinuspersici]
MGKRGKGRANEGNPTSGFHTSLSLREEASGKKQSHSSKSILKLKHLQNLAQWAAAQSGGKDDASLGCLGAFFGRRFAEFGESLGIPPDPSLFPCQSCETILQPGFNCTVRIEKNRAKVRRRSKTKTPTQNNVVYTCSFCSFRNLKRGASKGYKKEITGSKATSSKPKSAKPATPKCATAEKSNVSIVKTDEIVEKSDVKTDKASEAPSSLISEVSSSPKDSSLATSGAKLLDSKRRKRKKPGPKETAGESMVSSAQAEIEKCSGTSKRKKPWTSLKDIAESEKLERDQRFKNFSIPFVL